MTEGEDAATGAVSSTEEAEKPASDTEETQTTTESPSDGAQQSETDTVADTHEVGLTCMFLMMAKKLLKRLEKHFPVLSTFILLMVFLRLCYEPAMKRAKLHYLHSFVSEVFPGQDLSKASISRQLHELGSMRSCISEFMKEDLSSDDKIYIADGHRIISYAKHMVTVEQGFDSKGRNKNQINFFLLTALTDKGEKPVYYKRYSGGTVDEVAFRDCLSECKLSNEKAFMIADKGVHSEENCRALKLGGQDFIMPLKRNSTVVKHSIPLSVDSYDGTFIYNGRTIFYKEVENDNGDRVVIFFDLDLYKRETDAAVCHAYGIGNDEPKEKTRKKNLLRDKTIDDLQGDKKAIQKLREKPARGVIALRVNDNNNQLNGVKYNPIQIYYIWKQRAKIEEFFKVWADTLCFDTLYLQDELGLEGSLFISYLSAQIAMEILNHISSIGQVQDISFKDVRDFLKYIEAYKVNGQWKLVPLKDFTKDFLKKIRVPEEVFITMCEKFNSIYNK